MLHTAGQFNAVHRFSNRRSKTHSGVSSPRTMPEIEMVNAMGSNKTQQDRTQCLDKIVMRLTCIEM